MKRLVEILGRIWRRMPRWLWLGAALVAMVVVLLPRVYRWQVATDWRATFVAIGLVGALLFAAFVLWAIMVKERDDAERVAHGRRPWMVRACAGGLGL